MGTMAGEENVAMFGVYQGTVIDVDDPSQMDRILVQVPVKFSTEILDWARPITIAPGWSWKPAVNDFVWVMFENGDPDRPLYLGSWWNQNLDTKQTTLPSDAQTNYPDTRMLSTPAGHKMVFDDTESSEKITLQSKSGHKIELDDADGNEIVTVQHKDGTSKLVIDKDGNVTVESKGDINVTAPAGKDILLNGGGLTASGKVVTTNHICSFTGAFHPAGSENVKATI